MTSYAVTDHETTDTFLMVKRTGIIPFNINADAFSNVMQNIGLQMPWFTIASWGKTNGTPFTNKDEL